MDWSLVVLIVVPLSFILFWCGLYLFLLLFMKFSKEMVPAIATFMIDVMSNVSHYFWNDLFEAYDHFFEESVGDEKVKEEDEELEAV